MKLKLRIAVSMVIILLVHSTNIMAKYDTNPFPDNNMTIQTAKSLDFNTDFDKNTYNQGQPANTYKITSPPPDQKLAYWYHAIYGSDTEDDNLIFYGNFKFDSLNLNGGNNSVTFLEGSEVIGTDMSSYQNINTVNVQQNVKIESWPLVYNGRNIVINLQGGDPTQEKDIIFGKFELVDGSNKNGIGTINVSGQVDVTGNMLLSNHDEIINLADGKLKGDGTVDETSISVLNMAKGLGSSGGNNTLNMGKFAKIVIANGTVDLGGGNNTINLAAGSSVGGGITTEGGNNVINVASLGSEINNADYTISIDNISLGDGRNTINIANDSKFIVTGSMHFGSGNNQIIINDNSIFTVSNTSVANNIVFGSGSNYVYMGRNTKLNGFLKFNGHDNVIDINTNNNATNIITGTLTGSNNNDSFNIIGNGLVKINYNSPNALSGFNNINLDAGRLELSGQYQQQQDVNYSIRIQANDSLEIDPRLAFDGLARFNNTNINLLFKGQSQYLNKVGDIYTFKLLRDGAAGDQSSLMNSFSDIGLDGVNMNSAVYKIDNNISNNTVNTTLTKCSTFKDAVSGVGACNNTKTASAPKYVVNIAGMFDQLLTQNNLSPHYYDVLDKLSMMSLDELEKSLAGFSPIQNQVLLNINQAVANNFKGMIFDSNPYKLVKNNIALWSQYSYSNIDLQNTDETEGAINNSNALLVGADYTINSTFKIGLMAGAANTKIKGHEATYNGDTNSIYYGLYSFINLSNHLMLRLNAAAMSGKYNLTRYTNLSNTNIGVEPNYSQFGVDSQLEYKIKIQSYIVSPFVSVGYSVAQIDAYNETGDMGFNINKTSATFINSAVGSSILTVTSFNGHTIVPSLKVSLNLKSQNISQTSAYLASLEDPSSNPLNFTADDYGKIVGNINAGVSYFINSYSVLSGNVQYSRGSHLEQYNIMLNLSFNL